jgi:spermidine/putrescine transport system permease protein
VNEAAKRFGWSGLAAIFGAIAVWAVLLIILPIGLMMDLAFRPFLEPRHVGGPLDVHTLKNFDVVLFNPFNRAIFLKTIWASVLVTIVTLAVAYPLSFILARGGRASWVGLLVLGLLIPFWVNEVLRTFAWQLLLARLGPINQVLQALGILDEPYPFLNQDIGVIVGLVYAYILFMIFPLYNAIESLDPNQVEACRDLGAPWWRVHWDIVIPHAKPGIASGCIVTFMLAAGSFVVPQLLGGTRSLWFTQLIYSQFDAINWNMGSAYGLALVVLCLVFILAMSALFRVNLRDIAK